METIVIQKERPGDAEPAACKTERCCSDESALCCGVVRCEHGICRV